MDSILVRAKLHRPVPPTDAIPRPHLIEHLQNGIGGKVTLVSAPAGFGKSTVVSAWLSHLHDRSPMLHGGWLGLEEADDNLPRFVRYLVAAIEAEYPHSCSTVLPLLYDKVSVTIESLADVLVNDLTQLPGKVVLALDDLHLIRDNAIYAFLARLIQLASSHLHLVIITRVDPPLPLSRWRAQGQLTELRIHHLSFTLEETSKVLADNLLPPPNSATVSTLHELTEGWAVGLRLAILALRGVSDHAAFVTGFQANSNRYIIDYLVDDVLDQLPPSVQQFLSATAILNRFCPALCAAVLEIDETAARQQIDFISRVNLFLIELSSPAHWYRYHHQFQSMLLSRLHERYDQQAITMMHRQAAAWLASNNQVGEAIRHLTAISDFAAAADLIESQRILALNEERFGELDGWLALLPAHVLNQRPALLVGAAWVQNYWLNDAQSLASVERAQRLLQEQASSISTSMQKLLQAELFILRILQARPSDREGAIGGVRHHWTQIRPYLAYTHWSTVVSLSHVAHFLGSYELAHEILLTTFDQVIEWSASARARLLYSAGILNWYNCNLALAERLFYHSLHLARQHNLQIAVTLASFGLALVASARNQHEQAEHFHFEVLKEPHYQNGLRAAFSAYCLVEMYAASGRPEAARVPIESLKAHALLVGRPYLLNQVEALEAFLALTCGNMAEALRWALAASRGKMYRHEDRIPLIRTHILLAEGSPASLQEASEMLQGLIRQHEHEARWSLWIEVLILDALTWSKLGKMELALASLGKAVLRAVPNGVVGHFIVRGKPLVALLNELSKQHAYAQPVQLLLAAFPPDQVAPAAQEQREQTTPNTTLAHLREQLPEPLTEREQDVLKLLVGRLSNKEIASQLIVSPHTVRNHTANIFGKLQVANRSQAVERARALGILPPAE